MPFMGLFLWEFSIFLEYVVKILDNNLLVGLFGSRFSDSIVFLTPYLSQKNNRIHLLGVLVVESYEIVPAF